MPVSVLEAALGAVVLIKDRLGLRFYSESARFIHDVDEWFPLPCFMDDGLDGWH